MPLTLCVMLWAAPGQETALADYEDRVLARLGVYGARVVVRVRAVDGEPDEVQILEFPSEEQLEAFQNDPERLALAELRNQAIARTEIVPVEIVS